jgi:hypothetical protein
MTLSDILTNWAADIIIGTIGLVIIINLYNSTPRSPLIDTVFGVAIICFGILEVAGVIQLIIKVCKFVMSNMDE